MANSITSSEVLDSMADFEEAVKALSADKITQIVIYTDTKAVIIKNQRKIDRFYFEIAALSAINHLRRTANENSLRFTISELRELSEKLRYKFNIKEQASSTCD
jgi:hypothetical protein